MLRAASIRSFQQRENDVVSDYLVLWNEARRDEEKRGRGSFAGRDDFGL